MTDGSQSKRLLSYALILVLGLVFTLNFGPTGRGCQPSARRGGGQAAATVNGTDIHMADFQRQFLRQLEAMKAQGSPITESLARQLGFPKQILDRMVDAELLAQAAKERGIRPSDEELRDLLQKNPDFQKDGHFDLPTYTAALRDYYRKTPTEYENELRRALSAQKVLELVESGALVSDEELKARYQKEGNKASVTFVRFLPSMFAEQVKPKPEEITAWAKAHETEISEEYERNKFLYQRAGADGGSETKSLAEVSPEIARSLYVKEKSQELAKAAADAALAKAKSGKKLSALFPAKPDSEANPFAVPTSPEVQETGEFNQSATSIPKLGPAKALSSAVFAQTGPALLDQTFQLTGGGYAVAEVTSRAAPSEEQFTAQKEALREEGVRAKQMELRESFLNSLRKSAKITVSPEISNQPTAS